MKTLNAGSCSTWRRDDAPFARRTVTAWGSSTAFPRRRCFEPSAIVACGYAAYTLFPPDTDVLSAEFKINLLAPAMGRELIATAEVVHHGRRLSVCLARIEVDPKTANGRLCAIMLAVSLS